MKARKAMDLIRVYNPTAKDITVDWADFHFTIAAKSQTTLPRFLALQYMVKASKGWILPKILRLIGLRKLAGYVKDKRFDRYWLGVEDIKKGPESSFQNR